MFLRMLLLVVAVASATAAQANWLTISPVVIEIANARKPFAVRITNDSNREATFQLDAFSWQQVNGKDVYAPSDDLVFSPAILVIPPRKSQTFRVLLRDGRPSPAERTYRVMVEDIGEASVQTDTTAIAFKFTHNLPVLVAPSGKVSNSMRWKPCATPTLTPATTVISATPEPSKKVVSADHSGSGLQDAPESCVRLLNSGNRRIKVQALTLTGEGWQQSLSLKTGENVLVGAEREWRVPLRPEQRSAIRGVQVQTAESGLLSAESGGF